MPKVNSTDDCVCTFVRRKLLLCKTYFSILKSSFKRCVFYRVVDLHENHLANIVRAGEESGVRWSCETQDGIENKG